MKTLNISKDLFLPIDAATQTFGILAKKRRGKTYTASVMAEEMVKAGIPFAVLDPTGAWWGLRASADGKKPGYPVIIIGGDHGDIPLEPGAGAIIADLVVEHPSHYVIDMSQMNSNADQDRFAMEFGERLYRAKAKARFPMHLFVDEADAFIPQQPMPDQRRMLGAYDTIVRRGGIRGMGVTLISQRPAVINKNVLSQVECLVVLQIVGATDRDAIEKWVGAHGARKTCDELMGSLASLGLGEAWFWSPAWLDIFKKVQVRKRDTFNSSKTPEVGDEAVQPKVLADVDIKAVSALVAATIERVKSDDPKALRRRILELEREISERKPEPVKKRVGEPTKIKTIEIPAVGKKAYTGLQGVAKILERHLGKTRNIYNAYGEDLTRLEKMFADLNKRLEEIHQDQQRLSGDLKPGVVMASRITGEFNAKPIVVKRVDDAASGCSRPQITILNTLESFSRIGMEFMPRPMVAAFCRVSPSSSGFEKNLSTLRSKDFIFYPDPGSVSLTDAGRNLTNCAPPPSMSALHESWCAVVSRPQAAILRAVIGAHPSSLGRDELAAAVGVSSASSGFEKNLSRLRTYGAIDYPRVGLVCASENLYPESLK